MLGLDPPPPATISFPTPVAAARKQTLLKNNNKRQRRRSDYMEVPPSMASSQRPREPWEESLRAAEQHSQQNSKSGTFLSRPFMAVLFFVTLALAAGTTLMDGDGNQKHASEHSTASAADHVSPSTAPGKSSAEKTTSHTKKQRGKLLPAARERKEGIAEDMYNAYRELEEEYHEKAFHPENEKKWKLLNKKDNVQVSLLEHESEPACPYVRMEAVLPSSVAKCWDFLSIPNWHITMPKMDPFYEDHEMFSNYTHKGVNMVLVRKRTHRIFTFGKRDFAFLSVSDEPLKDGTWVSGTVSVDTPDVPRQPGYTRAFQDSIAFYKAVKDEETGQEHCHLTIVCRIDMNDSSEEGSGGFMPMWLYVKTIGTTGTKSVIRMRDALIEMKKKYEQRLLASAPTSVASQSSRPPTQSPTGGQDVPETRQQDEKPATTTGNDKTWWNRWCNGAFVSKPSSPQQKWHPFYGVFLHYPTNEAPTMSSPDSRFRWGLPTKMPWLQRFGNQRRATQAM